MRSGDRRARRAGAREPHATRVAPMGLSSVGTDHARRDYLGNYAAPPGARRIPTRNG